MARAACRPRLRRQSPWLLLLLLLEACDKGSADLQMTADAPAVPVRVEVVRRGDVAAIYSGTATFEAEREAAVVAKVGGEIREILVEEGDQVAAGQVLARLDGERLGLEVERIEANLRKLQRDYQRNIELFERGLVSSGAFESLKFDLEALQAEYELARLELGYVEIRAPIDGVIAERHIKLGNTIAADTAAFQLVDLDPLLAELYVPEREFRKLAVGMAVSVRVDALPGREFDGHIKRISPIVDPATGTFKATVELDDPSRALKPGMFGRLDIVYELRAGALLIPRLALLDEEGEPFVYSVADGLAHRRAVETGLATGADLEIRAGLAAGEQVVVVGQHGLKDGANVELVAD